MRAAFKYGFRNVKPGEGGFQEKLEAPAETVAISFAAQEEPIPVIPRF